MTSSTTVGQGLFAQRYELKKSLGQGSAGKVYLAFDTVLQEHVALKTLNDSLTLDDVQVKRFIREVSVTRKVTHPNVVRTYDVGRVDSTLFFTMEHVPGRTLKERLNGEPLSVDQALSVLYEICKGLHAIHESDIVHRDLKLTNIIIGDDGFVKIGDFGVARPGKSDLTTNDDLVGTATHMAPEVWRSGEITRRTDLYAVGVLMYEIFAGILPFSGGSAMELMYHHLHSNPPSICELNPSVPKWIDSLALRLLSKDPEDRPATVEEIIFQIEHGGRDQEEQTSSPDIKRSISQSIEFSMGPAVLNESLNTTLKPSIGLAPRQKTRVVKTFRIGRTALVAAWIIAVCSPLIFAPAIFNLVSGQLPRPDISGKAFLHFFIGDVATLGLLMSWPFLALSTRAGGVKAGLFSFAAMFLIFITGASALFISSLSVLFTSVPFSELFGLNTEYVMRLVSTYELVRISLIRIIFFTIGASPTLGVLIGSGFLIIAISWTASSPFKLIKFATMGTLLCGLLLLFRTGEIHALATLLEGSSHGLLLPIGHAAHLFLVWGLVLLFSSIQWNRPKSKASSDRGKTRVIQPKRAS